MKLISKKTTTHFSEADWGDEAQPQTTSKWKAKLAILSVSKKKVNQTTLPSNYFRRYKKSRRIRSPPILSPSFPFHHSFSKQPIILSSVALHSTHFSLSFKHLQSFTQSIQHLLRKKNSCNMRTSNGWKSSLFFDRTKSQTMYKNVGRGNLFTTENSSSAKNAKLWWHDWHALLNKINAATHFTAMFSKIAKINAANKFKAFNQHIKNLIIKWIQL